MGLAKFSVTFALLAVVSFFAFSSLPSCYDHSPFDVKVMLRAIPTVRAVAEFLEELGIARSVEVIRALMNSGRQPDTAALRTEDTFFDNVPVRVYYTAERKPYGAALFYFHGGGWAIGNLDHSDLLVGKLAQQLKVVVISVDYRLAPEYRYPAAIDDVERAFRFFSKHASDYDVDASRIAVAGDSAGGNLAAALAIRVRDSASSSVGGKAKQAEAKIKLQVLLYPVTQAVNFTTTSHIINRNDHLLPRDEMIKYYLLYALGMDYYDAKLRNSVRRYLEQGCMRRSRNAKLHAVDKVFKQTQNGKNDDIRERILTDDDRAALERARDDGEARRLIEATCTMSEREAEEVEKRLECLAEASFSPLLVESVEGLPAAYVVSCKPDVLRDDALLYVERLREGGVRVEHVHESNECHGFLSFAPDAGVERLRSYIANSGVL